MIGAEVCERLRGEGSSGTHGQRSCTLFVCVVLLPCFACMVLLAQHSVRCEPRLINGTQHSVANHGSSYGMASHNHVTSHNIACACTVRQAPVRAAAPSGTAAAQI